MVKLVEKFVVKGYKYLNRTAIGRTIRWTPNPDPSQTQTKNISGRISTHTKTKNKISEEFFENPTRSSVYFTQVTFY